MSEPDDLSPADLEAVSAHLDGEATTDEAARIDADAELRAELERLRAVRDRLAVDDPPAADAEARISAALAAFDSGPANAPVVDLAAARQRRWYHRVPLGAVAAALLVVAAIGAITQIDVDSGDDTATAADSGDDSAGDSAEGAGEDLATEETMAADAGAGTGSAELDADDGSAPGAFGGPVEVATVDELAAHVARDLGLADRQVDRSDDEDASSGGAPDSSLAPTAGEACDPVGAAGIEGEPLLALVPAVVAGRPVTAVVVDTDDRRLVVVDDETCSVIDDRVLDP